MYNVVLLSNNKEQLNSYMLLIRKSVSTGRRKRPTMSDKFKHYFLTMILDFIKFVVIY